MASNVESNSSWIEWIKRISTMNYKIDVKKEIAKRKAIRKYKQRGPDTSSRLYDVGFISAQTESRSKKIFKSFISIGNYEN